LGQHHNHRLERSHAFPVPAAQTPRPLCFAIDRPPGLRGPPSHLSTPLGPNEATGGQPSGVTLVSTITSPAAVDHVAPPLARPKPIIEAPQSISALIVLWVFVVAPFVALIAAIPIAWGWGLSPLDAAMAVVGYVIAGFGVAVGYHRHLTHGSFKARRPLRVALAVAGSLAVEGSPTEWVADHRRHHAFADREGDPHSPWRYGTSVGALAKGLVFAHCGWFFTKEITNKERFAPDLLADRGIRVVDRLTPALVAVSLLAPALIGGLVTGSWIGALTGFFWGGLVRMALLHHVTWSVNSICHVVGTRPFTSKDKATNFWPLAIMSFGESWHNSHHADPTGARHGVLRGQIDPAARVIWLFEKAGWAYDVRWPQAARLAAKRTTP
jgi:stearoyl-CoA desaturase (Delta-9 desaturase)